MPSQSIEDWGLPKSLSRKTASKIIYAADCADEQCKAWAGALTKIADECMSWTESPPEREGRYLFISHENAVLPLELAIDLTEEIEVRRAMGHFVAFTHNGSQTPDTLDGWWLEVKLPPKFKQQELMQS